MEHGLYVKIKMITDKLANEKGCMIKDPEHYKGEIKTAMYSSEIPFGVDKGKLEYYDRYRLSDFHDFIKKCFAILPRDNLSSILNTTKTGVTMDTLLSDKPCSEEERMKQKLTIYRFFKMARGAGRIRFYHAI